MPYFSIIIPTYNRSQLVVRAVESVFAQTFSDFELLVIDDGSTDDTRELLSKFSSDNRFKYVFQHNAKESAARNNGIMKATGDYICFLDSDDIYYNHHLSVLKRVIEENNHLKAFYYTFSDTLNQRGELGKKPQEYVEVNNPIYRVYVNRALVNNVCFPQEIIKRNKFREDIFHDEDGELFYRIASEFPVVTIPEYTTLYYEHSGNTANIEKSSYLYSNRILSIRIFLENPKIIEAFPKGFFEGQLSKHLHWYAEALLREGKSSEARLAMRESIELKRRTKFNATYIRFILRSFLKR